MSKYNYFLDLVRKNFTKLESLGQFKSPTLEAYLTGTRRARPVSIMLIASSLDENWRLFV